MKATGQNRKFVDEEIERAAARMVTSSDVAALREAMHHTFDLLGFGGYLLLTPVTLDPRFGRVMTSVGLPEKFVSLYEAGVSLTDPLPTLAVQTGECFRWSDTPKKTKLSREEKQFFKTLERFGISEGVAVPVYGPGGRAGYAGLALPTRPECMEDARLLLIQSLVQLSFIHYCKLIGGTNPSQARLSQRELDVVFWIAKGKSNSAIADILDISAETVDSYVRRVFAKLDVSDRTSASLSAALQGHIYTGDFVEHSSEP